MLNVTFFGVRGSTPCPCEGTRRYGGNTACVALEAPGEDPIILDLGTGLRLYGETQPLDGSFVGTALVSHLHWDHVQGLPFFAPINRPGARFEVYGPMCEGGLGEALGRFMCPPYFPIGVGDLAGDVRFHDHVHADLRIGAARVKVRPVPHLGPTNGYRVDWNGVSVAYVSDHQQPVDGSHRVAEEVLELCDGADLVIHDAQYTAAEWAQKAHWGHCTVDYALHVAREAGARRLALFHHDPGHSDAMLDELGACLRGYGERLGIEVLTAAEGLTVSFDVRRGG